MKNTVKFLDPLWFGMACHRGIFTMKIRKFPIIRWEFSDTRLTKLRIPQVTYRIASSQPTLFSQIGEQSANGGADTSDQPPWATAGVAPPRFLPQLTAKWL
ncbi:hypothetical protein ACU4GI_04910 [Cupriavidus basilensis]